MSFQTLIDNYQRDMQYNKEYPKDMRNELPPKIQRLKLKLTNSPDALPFLMLSHLEEKLPLAQLGKRFS